MIIEIVGKPRAGKTALNTLFMARELLWLGPSLQHHSMQIVGALNEERDDDDKLIIPRKPPILSNYEAAITTGYKKTFKPYFLNPYKLGIPTPQTADKLQYIMPCSCIHVTEGRKYWDGRESSTMPDNVSQFFETHGHNYITLIIDAQRGKSLDLNIRENANKFIEVQGMVNIEDAYGRVIHSTWYCREFYSLQDYEAYIAGKAGAYYRNTTFSYDGNIFELYQSRNRQQDFVPPKGQNYSTLEFVDESEMKKLPKRILNMYDTTRPTWYRTKQAAVTKGVTQYAA